ncbi:phytanoyl-CoA dioxygenase family protein [Halioglobus maricola]|uniref:Phytanoyl-CoA dioxygenase family protein n=1 Tax=Halioglobus maricola TaxID=2601894 RepID=A0A5P9NNY1_9GAMM|nr:phytanoyl-CoA dioxygenase family protein [Halioglobus maricola]QFU77155.1 phytanoyl-CoA dioxygenase family protein [Halioglobus maricola]
MSNEESGRDDPRFRQIDSIDQYVGKDLAGTHGFTRPDEADAVDSEIIDCEHGQLMRDGYLILRDLVSLAELEELREQSRPLLEKMGRNSFEGERTQRIYGVPEKLRAADRFIEHPHILAHLDRLLMPNYLLSQAQVINILTGSPAQPLHIDDGFYPWPRPRPALSVATVFAVDDFTEENGATVAIPGSHLWAEDRFPQDSDPRIRAVMPAGSAILFLGNLWHGGGENQSGASRLAITAQYCEPWLRTQENYFLSVSRETAAEVSENMRRMLGYSIHPPFMGMVEGMHPKRKLPLTDQP